MSIRAPGKTLAHLEIFAPHPVRPPWGGDRVIAVTRAPAAPMSRLRHSNLMRGEIPMKPAIFAALAAAALAASPAAAAPPMGKAMKGISGAAPSAALATVAPGCASTGWVADNNSSSHVAALRNPAGVSLLSSLTIYFSPGGDPAIVYPLQWSYSPGASGNPVTIEVTAANINLHIYSGEPLHGVWEARTSTWRNFSSGYWIAVACK